MSGLKRTEQEIGLVELDRQKEAEEVERKIKKESHVRLAAGIFLAGTLAYFLLGMLLCDMQLVVAGAVMVIEAILARVMKSSLLWYHIGIMALQLAMGFVFGHWLFLIIAACYYFLLVIVLQLLALE